MARTPALDLLAKSGAIHKVHSHEVNKSEPHHGAAVAAALGVDPAGVFKTLVAAVDDHPAIAIVPVLY